MREGLINRGDSASAQRTIREEDITQMARISMDYNPLHLDSEYAETTRFGKRIAHGLFTVSMISALLAMKLPGKGTVILEESFRFLKHVYIDDTITAQITVDDIVYEKSRVILSFACHNQNKECVMVGGVTVVVPGEKIQRI